MRRPPRPGRHRAGRRAAAGVPQGHRARERLPAAPAHRGPERGRDPDPVRPRGPAPGRGRDARRDARGRRRGLPGDVLRRRAGAARPTSCCAPTGPATSARWSYDIADTKLARRLKVPALLQMATYAERLTVLQGVPPRLLTVVTGDGVERALAAGRRRVVRAAGPGPAAAGGRGLDADDRPGSGARTARSAAGPPTAPTRWEQADDLSLVAGMRSGHRHALIAAGLPTVEALAAAAGAELPRTIGRPSRERLAQQARLQVERADHRRAGLRAAARSPTAGCCGCRRPATATSTSTSRATRSPPTARAGSTSPASGTAAGASPPGGPTTHDAEGELTRGLLDDLTRAARRRPGHARLPLRALRADRAEAAHRAARHPRDRARRAAARRAVRRPVRRRAAGAADQQAVLLDQEARGLLLGAHPHRGRRGRGRRDVERRRVRTVPGRRRHLGPGRRSPTTTATTCARPTTCTPGWSSGGPSSSSGTEPSRARPRRTARRARPSPTPRWPRPSSPTGSRRPGTRCWPASSAGTGARSARSGGTSTG